VSFYPPRLAVRLVEKLEGRTPSPALPSQSSLPLYEGHSQAAASDPAEFSLTVLSSTTNPRKQRSALVPRG
jgi:hypothetical protein